MNASRIILACSALVNAVLGYALTTPPPKPSAAPPASSQPGQHVVTRTTVERSPEVKEGAPSTLSLKLDWRQLESEDFKEYIANLRASGCPERTIWDIIIADVNKLYAARWQGVMGPAPSNHWEHWDLARQTNNPALRFQYAQLEAEREAVVYELLGAEYRREMRLLSMSLNYQDRDDAYMSFLPPDTAKIIMAMHEKMRRHSGEILARRTNGKLSEADNEALNQVRQREKDEMRTVLTEKEYDELMLRTSWTAHKLRANMIGFDSKENEFRALVSAEFALKEHGLDPKSPDYAARYAELQEKTALRVREAFGEERYAEYQKARDRDYQELMRFAHQETLDREIALKVFDIKKSVEAKARELASLPPDQRFAAASAIQAEANRAVAAALGESAYQKYRMVHGQWLRIPSGVPMMNVRPAPAR